MKKLLLLLLLIPTLLCAQEQRKPTKKEWQKAKKILEESRASNKYWYWDGKVEVDRLNGLKSITFKNTQNKGCIFYYTNIIEEDGSQREGTTLFFNKKNNILLTRSEEGPVGLIKIKTEQTKKFDWALKPVGDGHNYYFLAGTPKAAGEKDIRQIIVYSDFIALSYTAQNGVEYLIEFDNNHELAKLREAAQIYLSGNPSGN